MSWQWSLDASKSQNLSEDLTAKYHLDMKVSKRVYFFENRPVTQKLWI